MEQYFQELKSVGMPFSGETSGKYAPLSVKQFAETLYDYKTKAKTSPMAQMADLYAWPMAFGGYKQDLKPYKRLKLDGKLIDCHLTAGEIPYLGCKYSCFDLVYGRKDENPDCSGFSAATVG